MLQRDFIRPVAFEESIFLGRSSCFTDFLKKHVQKERKVGSIVLTVDIILTERI